MRRVASFVLVLTITFSFGVMVSQRRSMELRRTTATSTQNAPNLKFKREYEPGGAVLGLTNDGYEFCRSGFVSPDGIGFSREIVYCKSRERATRRSQQALKQATEVISREEFLARNGHPAGAKFIARVFPSSPEYGAAAILWVDGSNFQYVSSSSLQNILTYEKDWEREER